MSKNIVETLVGAVVIIIAAGFLYFAYTTTDLTGGSEKGYTVIAKFDRADGLNLGSDVKIGGVKIGKVIDLNLDRKTYQAIAKIRVRSGIDLPVDSTAEIISNGLLGDKYVAIVPGSDIDHIADNGVIEFTQSSISLENLIGKYIFGSANKDKGKGNEPQKEITIPKD